MKPWLLLPAGAFFVSVSLAAETAAPAAPDVPYPDGFRQWTHVTSVVLPPKNVATPPANPPATNPAPHGLIFNIYANEKAVEGYRSGHFPEGAVLIADWFILEEKGPSLVQGPRKSVNVMVRDARYAATGGWGFEDFAHDSHTTRNVGQNAVKACFECHGRAKDHEYVFSTLRP